MNNQHQLCQNGGHCRDIGNSHECICSDGYYGSYCQHEVDECAANPCQNGGTCKDLIGNYQCVCPKGYQGKNCEFNINDCDPNPCQNNGICYDLVDDFRCACPHGTIGILCEINVNECFDGACHHGGTCIDKIGKYFIIFSDFIFALLHNYNRVSYVENTKKVLIFLHIILLNMKILWMIFIGKQNNIY